MDQAHPAPASHSRLIGRLLLLVAAALVAGLSFAAGETSKTITVDVLGDLLVQLGLALAQGGLQLLALFGVEGAHGGLLWCLDPRAGAGRGP